MKQEKNKIRSAQTQLLTFTEVAKCLNFSYRALQKHWAKLQADGLRVSKIGSQWRVRPAELERFILEREQNQA